MKIKDLPAPVTASKADWLAGDTWLGFTPTDGDLTARNNCQNTIQRQYGHGYVLEYITEQFSEPNPGFENDSAYIEEREAHRKLAGRLVAVHKLRVTARPLEDILGAEAFQRLQDMWAQGGKRHRWSVAFPIIESYEIVGHPKAKQVLGEANYRRLYQRSSATLRPLNEAERACIADLEITRRPATNAWIGIEDEFARAIRSTIDPKTQKLIDQDLGALEGMPEERRMFVRKRAAWRADQFIRHRVRTGKLSCDECEFDPARALNAKGIRPRSLLDVHHKHPMAEGVRYTNLADFALLCPTCHRIEHARLRLRARAAAKPPEAAVFA